MTLLLLCCEVLSSEATYVARLDDLLLRYVNPLKVRHGQLRLDRADVDGLFSYIEPIVDLHHKILEQLAQARLPAVPAAADSCVDVAALCAAVGHIAETFVSYHAYLKMYVTYVNSYNASMETLKRLSDGRRFVQFLAQTHRPPVLDLPSYLIMPIQRIPRYEMFLASLVRLCSPQLFPCYPRLVVALTHIQGIAALINESKRSAEAAQKLLELGRRVRGLGGAHSAAAHRSPPPPPARGRHRAAAA